jgi:hypothetical protein
MHKAVMPREGGASSTPWLLSLSLASLEYWIARFRGRRTSVIDGRHDSQQKSRRDDLAPAFAGFESVSSALP